MSGFRRITTLVLAAVVCLFCIACAFSPSALLAELLSPSESAADPEAYRAEFQHHWAYRELTSSLQSCYGTMYTALTDNFDRDEWVAIEDGDPGHPGIRIVLPSALNSKEEAQELYNSFFRDNPQFFYVSNLFGLTGYQKNGQTYYNTIILRYSMEAPARAAAKSAMDTAAEEILRGRPPEADDYTTELYLHDRLIEHCTYDTQAAAEGYAAYPAAFSAYGALGEGRAVCEGYARAMQLLLHRAGIATTLVTGTSVRTGEEHMWNIVSVNGQNYHLDVTWDDSEDILRHNYFNLSTELLLLSHTLTPGQPAADTCVSETENFFIRSGTYIDTFQRQVIARTIAAQLEAGRQTVELRFAPDKFDSALLFLKNGTLTVRMVNDYLSNGLSLDEYTLYGETEECILSLRVQ